MKVKIYPKVFMLQYSFSKTVQYCLRGLEFSSYEIELRNPVTQNGVTLRVTNSKSKNKKLHFELLTRRFNFYFFTFELLTRSWKIKNYASSY